MKRATNSQVKPPVWHAQKPAWFQAGHKFQRHCPLRIPRSPPASIAGQRFCNPTTQPTVCLSNRNDLQSHGLALALPPGDLRQAGTGPSARAYHWTTSEWKIRFPGGKLSVGPAIWQASAFPGSQKRRIGDFLPGEQRKTSKNSGQTKVSGRPVAVKPFIGYAGTERPKNTSGTLGRVGKVQLEHQSRKLFGGCAAQFEKPFPCLPPNKLNDPRIRCRLDFLSRTVIQDLRLIGPQPVYRI